MRYELALWSNPYVWAIVTGALTGCAFSAVSRTKLPVAKRWAIALFLLTAALAFALIGVFVVQNEILNDIGLLYALVCFTVVTGLAARFPRLIGIPIFIIALATSLYILTALEGWNRYDPGRSVGRITMLSRDDLQMRLEIDILTTRLIASASGGTIDLEVETLQASPVWFFVGTYGRLVQVGETAIDSGEGRLRASIGKLPGWKRETVRSHPFGPIDLYGYEVSIVSDEIDYALTVPGG